MSKTTNDNFLKDQNKTNLYEIFGNQITDFLSNKISFSEEELKIFTTKVLVMINTLKQEYYNFRDKFSTEDIVSNIKHDVQPYVTKELLELAQKTDFSQNTNMSTTELLAISKHISNTALPQHAITNEITKFLAMNLKLEAMCNEFLLKISSTIFEEVNTAFKQFYKDSVLQIENNEVKIVSSNINSNEDNDTSATLDAIQNETVVHNTTASDTDILGHNHTEHNE